MKIRSTSIVIAAGLFAVVMIVAGALFVFPHAARANQADDTTIVFHGYTSRCYAVYQQRASDSQ